MIPVEYTTSVNYVCQIALKMVTDSFSIATVISSDLCIAIPGTFWCYKNKIPYSFWGAAPRPPASETHLYSLTTLS